MLLLALAGCRSSAAPEPSGPVEAAPASEPSALEAVEPPVAPADPHASSSSADSPRVRELSITVLSTTMASAETPHTTGEWGFSALVEVDGQRILFDTGAKHRTVRDNAEALGIDLSTVPTVVLSHHHDDHVGGLLTLRESVVEREPSALGTVHVAAGIFEPRRMAGKTYEVNAMLRIRPAFEATGGRFVVHDGPAELAPGLWLTGPVPRPERERNWGTSRRIRSGDGWGEDTLPESQSLVLDTDRGLVVLSGCGHAGIVNTVTYARSAIRPAPIHAAVGGFHLHQAGAKHLAWTGERLEEVELHHFEGAHCTGEGAVRRFAGLSTIADGGSRELRVGDRFVLESP
ncbi:MAG: MBL fold metallo-hydrolase [Myxococcales bacterium]|nr:MBL fold metallo-hydrolase [Myxococcales bacterium]